MLQAVGRLQAFCKVTDLHAELLDSAIVEGEEFGGEREERRTRKSR
jgi:hypothetical protein